MGSSSPPDATRAFLPGKGDSPVSPPPAPVAAVSALRGRGPALRSPDAAHGSSRPRFSCATMPRQHMPERRSKQCIENKSISQQIVALAFCAASSAAPAQRRASWRCRRLCTCACPPTKPCLQSRDPRTWRLRHRPPWPPPCSQRPRRCRSCPWPAWPLRRATVSARRDGSRACGRTDGALLSAQELALEDLHADGLQLRLQRGLAPSEASARRVPRWARRVTRARMPCAAPRAARLLLVVELRLRVLALRQAPRRSEEKLARRRASARHARVGQRAPARRNAARAAARACRWCPQSP